MLHGPDRAPARAMLRAIGFSREDLEKPIIGVGHSWIETMPCNWNHRALAEKVKEGVRAAGGTPMEFNTIAVSDGVTHGNAGDEGLARLPRGHRRLRSSSSTRGHSFDGLVLIVGCDKTIPAAAMALCRMDIPGLVLYGGTIQPGRCATVTSRSRTSSKPSAPTTPAGSTLTSSARSRSTPARERAHVAVSTPRTR